MCLPPGRGGTGRSGFKRVPGYGAPPGDRDDPGDRPRRKTGRVGLAAGYLLSWALGVIPASRLREVFHSPWVLLPFAEIQFGFAFSWSLVPVFVIVSITGALKSFGNLIMCEKVNDADWREPDMDRVANGLLADAACVTVSGLLGGVASDTSASNVSLSKASGATSRTIAYTAGLLFIILGFPPRSPGCFP